MPSPKEPLPPSLYPITLFNSNLVRVRDPPWRKYLNQPVPSQHAAEQVEPEQAALQGIPAPKPKHFHYTPELKLQLIHLCIGNGDQYLEEPQEDPFWQYITAIFQQTSGNQGACARKKVTAMVAERKSTLEARDMLSGVAIPPVTDLEQAIDAWIEICERRLETLESTKSEASAETKKEKAISEMLRDNLTKRLSNKRRFQAIVEAREVVDLTAPGDVIPKRRHIRQNLRATPPQTPNAAHPQAPNPALPQLPNWPSMLQNSRQECLV
ncbi:hypothetical protein BGX38DRAFT_1258235 [Terfezia claveryi]|nr:hypothetical protein BGX38DRAFT_1258235 [Terfezia claveryi]